MTLNVARAAADQLGVKHVDLQTIQQGQLVEVRTHSGKLYQFKRNAEGQLVVKGGKYFPEFTADAVIGTKYGSGEDQVEKSLVLQHMPMYLAHPSHPGKVVATTLVKGIECSAIAS